MKAIDKDQRRICKRFKAEYLSSDPWSKVGIALQTKGIQPLNALRHPVEAGTCGWYIWWGEEIDQSDPEFFKPLHVKHLAIHCPQFIPYLGLAPGWRVQLSLEHEDVWFDDGLLVL